MWDAMRRILTRGMRSSSKDCCWSISIWLIHSDIVLMLIVSRFIVMIMCNGGIIVSPTIFSEYSLLLKSKLAVLSGVSKPTTPNSRKNKSEGTSVDLIGSTASLQSNRQFFPRDGWLAGCLPYMVVVGTDGLARLFDADAAVGYGQTAGMLLRVRDAFTVGGGIQGAQVRFLMSGVVC